MPKNAKTSIAVFNIAIDFIIQAVILAVQIIVLALIASLVKDRAWTYWIILGVLTLSILYFGFMFVYRLYRARLTPVRINKDGITYRIRFKKTIITAENLVVSLFDAVKPNKKFKYAYIYDKNNESDGFLFAVNVFKSLGKLKEFAPHALLVFAIMCTDEQTLKTESEKSSETGGEYYELVKTELECREQARIEAKKNRSKKKR